MFILATFVRLKYVCDNWKYRSLRSSFDDKHSNLHPLFAGK